MGQKWKEYAKAGALIAGATAASLSLPPASTAALLGATGVGAAYGGTVAAGVGTLLDRFSKKPRNLERI